MLADDIRDLAQKVEDLEVDRNDRERLRLAYLDALVKIATAKMTAEEMRTLAATVVREAS